MSEGSLSTFLDEPKKEIIVPDKTIVLPSKEIVKPSVNRILNKDISAVQLNNQKVLRLWRERPWIFIRDVLEAVLDDWQRDCAELYAHNPRLAMIASKGVGKTAFLNFVIWHFFMCHHTPKIACLSISKDHLMSNLWAELLMWRARAPLLENSTEGGRSRITMNGHSDYSFIDARAYPKQADEAQQASALAGLHKDNVMFAIDEAGMIPDAVLATADAALSTDILNDDSKKARLVVTGNPEQPSGMIYRASKGKSKQKWKVYNINADPLNPKRAKRVSIEWAQETIESWGGRDHPFVMVNVLGLYPNVTTDFLISEEDIEASMNRNVTEKSVANSQTRLGVDVARGGIDNTMLARRKGLLGFPIEGMSSQEDGSAVAAKISMLAQRHFIEKVYVDDTGGYGASALDHLKQFNTIHSVGVKYNSRATEPKRYYNKRTEMWCRMRDWIKDGGQLPNDPKLAEELMTPKLYFHGTQMRLEAKEQIKARLGRSPDRADAFAQTFFDVEEPSYYADYTALDGSGFKIPLHRGGYISDESQLDKRYDAPSNYKA